MRKFIWDEKNNKELIEEKNEIHQEIREDPDTIYEPEETKEDVKNVELEKMEKEEKMLEKLKIPSKENLRYQFRPNK